MTLVLVPAADVITTSYKYLPSESAEVLAAVKANVTVPVAAFTVTVNGVEVEL